MGLDLIKDRLGKSQIDAERGGRWDVADERSVVSRQNLCLFRIGRSSNYIDMLVNRGRDNKSAIGAGVRIDVRPAPGKGQP